MHFIVVSAIKGNFTNLRFATGSACNCDSQRVTIAQCCPQGTTHFDITMTAGSCIEAEITGLMAAR